MVYIRQIFDTTEVEIQTVRQRSIHMDTIFLMIASSIILFYVSAIENNIITPVSTDNKEVDFVTNNCQIKQFGVLIHIKTLNLLCGIATMLRFFY